MKFIELHLRAMQWIFTKASLRKYFIYLIPGTLLLLFFIFLQDLFILNTSEIQSENFIFQAWFYIRDISSQTLLFLIEQFQIFFILTFLSPLYAHLSATIEVDLTEKKSKFTIWTFLIEIVRMFGIILVALFFQGVLILGFNILSWFIDLEMIREAFYFCIAAFFFGFSFYDYPMERNQIRIFTSLSFARKRFVMILITGLIFSSVILIPYVGIIIAPILTTMISTYIFVAEREKFK